ncbi:hypothetical protein QLZ14_16615 [Cronobacter sakazakii]|nr:hypothetical protein [Cronobacter sakazakii]
MSTISNERLEKLSEYDCADRYEVMSMATELLALRKEREAAVPVAWTEVCEITNMHATGLYLRGFPDNSQGRDIPLYTTPPAQPVAVPDETFDEWSRRCEIQLTLCRPEFREVAEISWNACRAAMLAATPVDDDSLPYDPQIAEYEQMMEAEQAQSDTTAQQFESLAGKAVVPAGWKLVPIELTKEMLKQMHPFAEATCLGCGRQVVADCVDNVTASWNDMLAVAPEPCK